MIFTHPQYLKCRNFCSRRNVDAWVFALFLQKLAPNRPSGFGGFSVWVGFSSVCFGGEGEGTGGGGHVVLAVEVLGGLFLFIVLGSFLAK